EYSAVRFRVGVPYELNHLNGALSAPPLNVPGMFWTWQGGYRFVRTDWLVEGGEVTRWHLHLGSTGCVSEAATKPPGQPCSQPNLAHVGLEDFNPEQDIIRVDLSALIAGADLLSNVAGTSPGCMSGVEEAADCEPVRQALGLDQGACVAGCAGQSVFSVEP